MGLARFEGRCAGENPRRETIQTTGAGGGCAYPLQNSDYDSFPTSPLRQRNLIDSAQLTTSSGELDIPKGLRRYGLTQGRLELPGSASG
jgi:hypothetical protein